MNFRQKRMSVSPIHYPSYLSRLRSWHSDRFFPCGCLREQNFVQERSINSSSEIVESRTRRLLLYPLIFSWCLQEKVTYVYKMSNPSTRILVYIYTENHQGSFYKQLSSCRNCPSPLYTRRYLRKEMTTMITLFDELEISIFEKLFP